jgi:hypothetical protein
LTADEQQQENNDDDEEDPDEEEKTCPYDPSMPDENDADGVGSWDPGYGVWPEDNTSYGTTTISSPGAGTGTPGTKTVIQTATVEVTEVVIIDPTPAPTPPTSTTTVLVTPPAASPTTTNPKPPSPDPSQNQLNCYRSGRMAFNSELWPAVNFYCGSGDGRWAGRTIKNNQALEATMNSGDTLDVLIQFIGTNNCEFTIQENECKRIFGDILRGCGQSVFDLNYGGWIQGNCYYIRIDPASP